MKKITFENPPVLTEKEKRVAEMHSFLNILNVLAGEISIVEMHLDREKAASLVRLGDEILTIARDLKEGDAISRALTNLRESEGAVVAAVQALLQTVEDVAIVADISESLANIKSVYGVVHQRMDELETRAKDPDVWINIHVQEFERQFLEVFSAIEKNSKGRYRIFFNLARKSEGDYYIDFKIETAREADTLWMPLRMIDVIRDLTANARKYTEPGGKVALAIYQSATEVQVLIEDSGCGIPADEVERVIEFGYRASNVRDRPTMGGGFGLTKAAWLVHHWGGSLSIETAEGVGTIVRLNVPNKVATKSVEALPDFYI